jgi:alkylation response protein AidB-like acyl-CoA dehydrogenase
MEMQERLDRARQLEPGIEQMRAEMDERAGMTDAAVAALRESGVLRAAVPPELGGPFLDPLEQIELVEEFSRIDGAVGWCAMIGAASSFVIGFLDDDRARHWFERDDACVAGQLQPTGRAERVPGGYLASGRFRFGSGIGHATVVLGGCIVTEGGAVARSPAGRPEVRTVLFDPAQCRIIETWDTSGLRATGSHDYEIEDLFIPEGDAYDPTAPARRDEPLFRFSPLFLATHDGVPLGIARRAIDTAIDVVLEKGLPPMGLGDAPKLCDQVQVQDAVARAEVELGGARALCYSAVGDVWASMQAGRRVSRRERGMYRASMTYSHQVAKKVVGELCDAASTAAVGRDSVLDRQLRDIVTACQHRMVHSRVYAPAGRLIMGLESGDPTV